MATFVHGPAELEAVCHWYVTPVPDVKFAKERVTD
jgi:hypothetical protein